MVAICEAALLCLLPFKPCWFFPPRSSCMWFDNAVAFTRQFTVVTMCPRPLSEEVWPTKSHNHFHVVKHNPIVMWSPKTHFNGKFCEQTFLINTNHLLLVLLMNLFFHLQSSFMVMHALHAFLHLVRGPSGSCSWGRNNRIYSIP